MTSEIEKHAILAPSILAAGELKKLTDKFFNHNEIVPFANEAPERFNERQIAEMYLLDCCEKYIKHLKEKGNI